MCFSSWIEYTNCYSLRIDYFLSRFFEIVVIYLTLSRLDYLKILVNNSFSFLSALLYSVFKVHAFRLVGSM